MKESEKKTDRLSTVGALEAAFSPCPCSSNIHANEAAGTETLTGTTEKKLGGQRRSGVSKCD